MTNLDVNTPKSVSSNSAQNATSSSSASEAAAAAARDIEEARSSRTTTTYKQDGSNEQTPASNDEGCRLPAANIDSSASTCDAPSTVNRSGAADRHARPNQVLEQEIQRQFQRQTRLALANALRNEKAQAQARIADIEAELAGCAQAARTDGFPNPVSSSENKIQNGTQSLNAASRTSSTEIPLRATGHRPCHTSRHRRPSKLKKARPA